MGRTCNTYITIRKVSFEDLGLSLRRLDTTGTINSETDKKVEEFEVD